MGRRIAQFFALAALVAAVALLAGRENSSASLPQQTISIQMPAGTLKTRAEEMRRAAQLELDSIDGDTKTVRLKLATGPDPQALATINALSSRSISGSRQLTVNLTPPIRRVTEPMGVLHPQPFLPPQIRLLPPDSSAAAATADYRASGATGAASAQADSPLRPGTPRGLYVTAGLSEGSYPPAGEAFFDKFANQYGHAPDRYAIYGYEAVGLLVDAIDRVEDSGKPVTQQSVAAAAMAIRNRYSPVGHYDVLPSGQTTLYMFQARGKGAPAGPASLIEALR